MSQKFDLAKLRARFVECAELIHGYGVTASRLRVLAEGEDREAARLDAQRNNLARLVLERIDEAQRPDMVALLTEFGMNRALGDSGESR